MRADSQRGAALALTMILISALLAGGALALYLQVSDVRSAQYVTEKRAALYCAEAGLVGARGYVVANSGSWTLMLNGDTLDDPEGYPVEGDLDDDGDADWRVVIKDNDDEHPSDNPASDSDGTVFMISTCLTYPDTPREVMQLVRVSAGQHRYRNQRGQGAGNTSNAN